jgi:hypothetical protein
MTKKRRHVSRQYLWQCKMRSAGRCVICGKPAVTKAHCIQHALMSAKKRRKKTGGHPWLPGRKGKPPTVLHKEERQSFLATHMAVKKIWYSDGSSSGNVVIRQGHNHIRLGVCGDIKHAYSVRRRLAAIIEAECLETVTKEARS